MANTLEHKFIRTDSLVDEAFDPKRTRDFKLVLQIGTDGTYIGVNEKTTNKFIAFERYSFQDVYRFDDVCNLMDELPKQSALIKHTYHTVDCLVVNPLSTLVPKAVYEVDHQKNYLKFNTVLEGDELILADELKTLDAKNVFALPFCLKGKLDYLFTNIQYHHFSSVLIENLLRQHKNQASQKVIVHIQASHFQIVVLEGKHLVFYNT
ncbi:MAG TPA: DUF3822 family protein, partial [Bacteroidia bacterium]|nr:DUF3822 family protein [Bacteroidia bacterium]